MQRILHGNTVSRQQWHIKLWQCTIRPMTARLAKNQLTDIIGWGLTIDRRNPDPNTSKCTLCLTEQKSCQSLLWNFSLLGWIILDFFYRDLLSPLKINVPSQMSESQIKLYMNKCLVSIIFLLISFIKQHNLTWQLLHSSENKYWWHIQ